MEAKKDTEKDLIADRVAGEENHLLCLDVPLLVVHFGKLNIGASHVEKT